MSEMERSGLAGALAQCASVEAGLSVLCRAIEQRIVGALASVMVVSPDDGRMRHAAAPTLPAEFAAALDGIPVEAEATSCGAAACKGERVIIPDIANDPIWRGYRPWRTHRELARRFGLHACWAEPVHAPSGKVTGTLGLYFHDPRKPQPDELAAVEEMAGLASLLVERKNLQDRLQHIETRFRGLAQASSDWLWETDAEGRVTYVSEGYWAFSGLRPGDVLGRTRAELSPDLPCEGWQAHLENMAARRPYRDFVFARRLTDGSIAWLSSSGTPCFSQSGEFFGFRGICRNITAQVEAEQERRQREAQLQQIIDLVPHFIIARDAEGRYLMANRAAAAVHGRSQDEIIGLSVKEALVDPRQQVRFMENDRRVLESGQPLFVPRQEVTFRNGDARIIESFKIPYKEPGSDTPAVLSVSVDITEKIATEEKLQQQAQELAHIQRVNVVGQLSSALAHELNQPLAAMSGYIGAARTIVERMDGADSAKAGELMRKAARQLQRAGDITNGLRDFVRKDVSPISEEHIDRLVTEAADFALTGVRTADITVIYDVDDGLPTAHIDRIQIEQVVFNLVRNAAEAMGEHGGGELRIRAGWDDGRIRVTVCDTGPGIEDGMMARLFEPFVTTKDEGLGIGLSISQSIVEAHGGRIWAEQNPSGGMDFSFTLPVASAADISGTI